MFSRPLSCSLTVVVVIARPRPRPHHRRRERRCAHCSPLPQERFPFFHPLSPSLRALLASCPPFSVLPSSSLCRRCARCSSLPQERFPFFHSSSPPLRALLASYSSIPSPPSTRHRHRGRRACRCLSPCSFSFAIVATCYDRFSSPVGTENRGGSEVEEILTAAHREFGGCAHCCAGKPKRREQDQADPRRRGRARSGTAEE